MPTPATTRASRSRYSSPALGGPGAGARTSSNEGTGRGRDKDKDKVNGKDKVKGKENNQGAANTSSAPASRASSTERSRRFMENWIEPERVRLTSFQEYGLVRQGVLETMEPLGTRPKPAMIKKLVGMGREGSPTPSARGGKKKIVLKRKPGASMSGNNGAGPTLGSSELSPTPSTVAGMATPKATSPSPTTDDAQMSTNPHEDADTPTEGHRKGETPVPAVALLETLPSSPTPRPKIERLETPIILEPLSDPPSLPDPIKQSIEGLSSTNLSTTPRSIQSATNEADDFSQRASSVQSNMASRGARAQTQAQAQAQLQQLGPHYNDAELTRILQQRQVVRIAIEHAVAEAIKHRGYVEAYALRLSFNHNQSNARFLLQTESMFKQLITKEAAGEWARKLKPYKDEGAKDYTALKYFVPEAQTDKDFDFGAHQPLQSGYAHLVSIDMTEVRNPNKKRKPGASEPQTEPEAHLQEEPVVQQCVSERDMTDKADDLEAEPERVTPTPPRKRQKTQQRDSSTANARNYKASSASRSASTSSARTTKRSSNTNNDNSNNDDVDVDDDDDSSNKNNNGVAKVVASPLPRQTRADSNVSDISSLSSIRSMSPVHEPVMGTAEAARSGKEQGQDSAKTQGKAVEETGAAKMQDEVEGVDSPVPVANAGLKGVKGSGAAPKAVANSTLPPRRAPARRARTTLDPKAYLPVLPDHDPVSKSHPQSQSPSQSHSHSHSNNISQPNTISSDAHNQRHQQQQQQHPLNNAALTNPCSSASQNQPPKKSKRGMPDFLPQHTLGEADEITLQRSKARDRTRELTDMAMAKDNSFVRRESIRAPSPPERPETASSSSSLSSVPDVDGMELDQQPEQEPLAQSGRPSGARATRANKRTHGEIDDDANPFAADFGLDAAPDPASSSRAVTPSRPAKKLKTARRVKQSPMKNRAGPVAGGHAHSRAGSNVSPSLNDAAPNNQEENDDFCSFCGGNGNLVCCDGCQKAFHYMDHEPVVDPNEDAAWFCWDCSVKRDPSLVGKYKNSLFGDLMTNLDKKHAKAFTLPKKVREYFEGVRTGADGEYEEFVPPVKGKKKKETENKEFDFYQTLQGPDGHQKPILCHSCHQSALSSQDKVKRAIVPCTLCGLWWHADCLDPPSSLPPNPRTFVCPCHVDDLLLKVPAQLGPAHKFRKIKGSSEITYGFRRGNVNNGYIEVEEDESDSPPGLGMRDPKSWGRSYRVRASGVRDDFVSKVGGRNRPRKPQVRPKQPQQPRFPAPQLPAADYAEDAEDRYEAALNIMAFARKARADRGGRPVNFSSEALGVVNEGDNSLSISKRRIAAANANELAKMEAQLRQMQKLIKVQKRKRNGDDDAQPGPSTRRKTSHLPASMAPEPKTNEGADLVTAVEASEPVDDHHSPIVRENVVVEPGQVEPCAAEMPATDVTQAAVAHDTVGRINHEALKSSEAPAVTNGFTATPKAPADAVDQQADALVESAVCNAVEEVTETGPTGNGISTSVEKVVDQTVDAALTPVSDTAGEGDELPAALSTVKTSPNGNETPETNAPDQAMSTVEAEAMDLK